MKPLDGRRTAGGGIAAAAWAGRGWLALLWLATALPLLATEATNGAASDSAYAQWTRSWWDLPTNSPALGGAGLKLVVSCVRGEPAAAAVANMTPVERLKLSYQLRVSSTEVATNGSFRTYTVSNTDAQSTAVRRLAPEDWQLLDPMCGQLPDDHAQLPPAGQRVVVQFRSGGQWQVRVYDGRHLPPEVQDVIDLLAKPYTNLF